MGKYTRRKIKTSGKVSLMEAPSLCGVLTRAKTLALQRAVVDSSYIQLRSRRLVKPNSPKKRKERCVSTNPSELRDLSSSVDADVSVKNLVDEEDDVRCETENNQNIGDVNLGSDDEEGSFGENMLEIEGTGRTTRETTPCSLIRDPDAIKIHGSSTKSTRPAETSYKVQITTPRHIPSSSEMDEFFTAPEKKQQRLFIEKYNFDPVNDKPLPGRYEWVKLDATKKS